MAATETSPHRAVLSLTWLAAGLAAAASVLRGLGAEAHLHDWSPGTLVVIVAAAQMLFAVLLVVGPWSGRTLDGGVGDARAARALFLFGILGASAVLALDLLAPRSAVDALPGSGATPPIWTPDVVSLVVLLGLIVVLLVAYVLAGRASSASRPVDGPPSEPS